MEKSNRHLTATILLTAISGTYCWGNNKTVFDKANNIVTNKQYYQGFSASFNKDRETLLQTYLTDIHNNSFHLS